MAQYLDRIRVGKTEAVISAVHDDGTVEVVYNSGIKDAYEDAKFENGGWTFVHPGVGAGYAQGKPRLQDAVAKLNMSPELRHRLESN